jgi:hypothetical protein
VGKPATAFLLFDIVLAPMRPVLLYLKSIAIFLLWFGGCYAVMFYVAHFTEIQSLVLAAVALFAVDGYRIAMKVAGKVQPEFEPFWISIEPNWYDICNDYGLAAGEKWKELQEKCKGASGFSVLRNGLNFTMLTNKLFFSNDHKYFFGELDLKIRIEELRPDANMFSFAPQFYVKRTIAGEKKKVPAIEFGLVTQESLKKSFHPADDNANIPLAWLPEIVFFGFQDYDDWLNNMDKVAELQKAQLKEFGWTEKERDPEDSWLHWPLEINHKYFHVRYRGIE